VTSIGPSDGARAAFDGNDRARSCDAGPMGTLVSFRSTSFLLQREDFPVALRALHKLAKTVPSFFRDPRGVLALRDLPEALEKGELRPTLDDEGDMVGLRYIGDKVPPDGPDDFPVPIVFALKKELRKTRFELEVEGVEGLRTFHVDRGSVRSQLIPRRAGPRRFEAIGEAPVCAPGATVRVPFRLVSSEHGDRTEVGVRCSSSDSGKTLVFADRTMRPGDEAYTEVTLSARSAHRADEDASFVMYGNAAPSFNLWLRVGVALPAYDRAKAHDVLDARSDCWTEGRSDIYLNKKAWPAALVDLRRYAQRHAKSPGGTFLEAVGAAPDIESALRAASLGSSFDAKGHLRKLVFEGRSLPGGERHLFGLLASFAGLTGATGRISLRYADTPSWRTLFWFRAGNLERWREPVDA